MAFFFYCGFSTWFHRKQGPALRPTSVAKEILIPAPLPVSNNPFIQNTDKIDTRDLKISESRKIALRDCPENQTDADGGRRAAEFVRH